MLIKEWGFFFSEMGVMVGLVSFISNRKHLLCMLLSLEFIVLSLYCNVSYMIVYFVGEEYLLLFFLVIVVCEGALGLGVMVSMVRCWGNDYFSSIGLLKC